VKMIMSIQADRSDATGSPLPELPDDGMKP
jgi:hypothetical protein